MQLRKKLDLILNLKKRSPSSLKVRDGRMRASGSILIAFFVLFCTYIGIFYFNFFQNESEDKVGLKYSEGAGTKYSKKNVSSHMTAALRSVCTCAPDDLGTLVWSHRARAAALDPKDGSEKNVEYFTNKGMYQFDVDISLVPSGLDSAPQFVVAHPTLANESRVTGGLPLRPLKEFLEQVYSSTPPDKIFYPQEGQQQVQSKCKTSC